MTHRFRVALVAAAALACAPLALSGCASTPSTATASTPAQAADRAMLAAETAFNISATAELDAKSVGLLTAANAAKADLIRKQAYAALLGARAVYKTGQAPSLTNLLLLTNQLLLLSGQQPLPTVTVAPVPTL